MSADSTLKLLCTALGDPAFTSYVRTPRLPDGMFQCYRLTLSPARFRGLTPDWMFAVLDGDVFRHRGSDQRIAIQEAQQLVESRKYSELLFLISAEPNVHLYDKVVAAEDGVFCLDAANISRGEPQATEGKLSPFVKALQRRGLEAQPVDVISPYLRNKPVNGWRFFGRKSELRKLMGSRENYIVVGARRMGKTSLFEEIKSVLESRGEEVYYANVEPCRTAEQASATILETLSTRARLRAVKQGQALSKRPLFVALQELASRRQRTTLLLDELGYVIESMDPEVGVFLAGLRKHTQQMGNLRIIISCFQEIFVRQQEEFTGPLVNFGTTLRIEPFSDADVEEVVFAPLEIWQPLRPTDKLRLKKMISATVGHHPLFIQYFCKEFFERITVNPRESVVNIASNLVGTDMADCFEDAVKQVFKNGLKLALPKYIFLKRCLEADGQGIEPSHVELDDDWLIAVLKKLGFSAKTDARHAILEYLEVHGVCMSVGFNRTRQRIAVPIVYRYLKAVEQGIEEYVQKLGRDVATERTIWGLDPI